MKAWLTLTGDNKLAREFLIEEPIEIGRVADGWEVVLRRGDEEVLTGVKDSTVSKKHALIYFDSGKLMIKDLGSVNGTFLNNLPLPGWQLRKESQPVEIKGDSVIRLGSSELKVKVEAPPSYDELVKMFEEWKLEAELKQGHSEKEAQRLFNSFRIIFDINNNCCNTHTRMKELSSRFDSLKGYLTEPEFISEIERLQRKFSAQLFDDESLADVQVRELKEFCNRLFELWGARFMK
jgi:pSer/pThr/pTyr-binding forkhead associated (FHA) protein